jgi:hypothetical protein
MHVEDASGAFTLQIIFMLVLFFLLGFFIFGIQNVQTEDFKHYVDGELEKHGGLTSEAASNIEAYSNQYYEGRYDISDVSGTGQQPYGTPINYKIEGTLKLYFFDLPNQVTLKKGSTISLVR